MQEADKNQDDISEASTRDKREEKDKGSKGKGPSKVKDLSHVPCKFFKVGSCTAGSSCPFSHHSNEPGQQKDVCAWYVKGNCKFGHKCALAHVLPGQSMAMDRRNKKAAQLAQGGQSNGQKDRDGKADRGKGQKSTAGGANGSRTNTNPARTSNLLGGSTAPTRVLQTGSRPPLPISKAVPAPAATAPALKDADFAAYDSSKAGETSSQNGSASATSASFDHDANTAPAPAPEQPASNGAAPSTSEQESPTKAALLPLSTPSQPRRFTGRHGSSPSVDFGPVGSPPRSSPSNPTRVNGFSPGVSPREVLVSPPLLSTSTFSAPGGQTLFMPYEQNSGSDTFRGKSGLAASLGATRTLNMDAPPPPSQRSVSGPKTFGAVDAGVLEDDDMEEFIPSSLTDLLTPGERIRRMSRTSATNPAGSPGLTSPLSRPSMNESHHRYSRSVPAPSLLSDIKSIWAEPPNADPQPPFASVLGTSPGTLGLGAPSSFKSNGGLFSGNDGPSPSLLSPSNASAAFLPGLHQHYLSRPSMTNLRGTSQTNFASPQPPMGELKGTLSPSPLSQPAHRSPNPSDPFSTYSLHSQPIPATMTTFITPELPLSPSARALQAHAPGQSLPQGLAAGYSRIHVQPPPPHLPSPAMSGTFSPGTGGISMQAQMASGIDWSTNSAANGMQHPSDPTTPPRGMVAADSGADGEVGGLNSMFSRLSYSAAAARGGAPSASNPYTAQGPVSPGGPAVPMSMGRRPSGRGWSSHPLSSPLSGPVLTNDDDDLFSMDEEK
ncbi:hypothetical protein BD410DRAFT_795655 [Rickenella mellea]|uniref:C3H1-type domain-containing protein n=1 Tax=Rickenella mellea TaxID=50990 RepID=A0A4Y7PNK6_9AGAM|nr:hypothetical protein BD410DRAFT_795655 [Rickenella mellea]